MTTVRPKATRSGTTAIRMDPELHDRLADAAAERQMSMNDLVVLLCEYGLPRLAPYVPPRYFTDERLDAPR